MRTQRFFYEILNYEEFHNFMKRKNKKTKDAILYAVNNKTSIAEGGTKLGISCGAPHLHKYVKYMRKNGIMKQFKMPPRLLTEEEMQEKLKKSLRNEIRSLLMSSSVETLNNILSFLQDSSSSPTE